MAEEQTILMYMLGCDLESESGAATDDLMEILHTTAESHIHVIAYLGGSEAWWMPGLENDHCYTVKIQQGKMEILQDHGRQVSASKKQFLQFLTSYAHNGDDLILWGHGFPGFEGIGVDKIANEDKLSLAEMKEAFTEGRLHFRLIGFDACEMATLEAAWTFAPYADYFAASPEIEAVSGWNYSATIQALENTDADAPLQLREMALQAAKRNPSVLPLTVIDEKELTQSAPSINRLLNSSIQSAETVSLTQLAAVCSDKEAGMTVLNTLDGQALMISNPGADTSVELPDIQENYVSFLFRR